MRHQRHKRSLGVTVAHRKAMLANLVTSLVKHNRIKTTLARAKETSRLTDKMITLAKRNTLHARRQIIAAIRSKEAARKLIDELAPLFKSRNGGYTRILKYKSRAGDNAILAILEFTEFPEIKEPKKKKKAAKLPKDDKVKDEEAPQEPQPKPTKKSAFFNSLKKIGKK
ncbi:MAG: 50S ribosomal protein L17 [Candidatus Omnitrophica bacterium]|nr:50S ribosomal protein L17 [Candidatus Omnitrophota bacterium]